MADDATTTTVTFRRNHLVRLRGFNHNALDDKLVRIASKLKEATGKFDVVFLDDQARPPVPVVPARRMPITPEHFIHTCEYCLVAASAAVNGGRLEMCGRCKTVRYCNAECQRADWARHKMPDCIRFGHDRGWDTPLQQACIAGNVTEVRRLVEEGVDVDKATTNGPTPLYTAAVHGFLLVVQCLVEKGADVDRARATSFTPLYGAAIKGFLPIVRYFVEHGADKDKATSDGATPLYVAAAGGYEAVVRYLAEQGANVDKATSDGATPLYAAAQNGHFVVVRYLAEQGGDKDKSTTDDGTSPLYVAAQEGHTAVVHGAVPGGAGRRQGQVDQHQLDSAPHRGAVRTLGGG